ncbi:ribosome small subunit-dependent GTPase A [Mesosutterella sp. OilRF-GAM-744-9]|uniref:Small ribosomal subunit biogenesis GTPase RsgA n=1 Tax=Mesosutterella porci TaxID=2915351 RepID=A0ABS9MPG9_9BURK|nr:ribosome small subunit-dependent GTPase A [Mesosutterella sp. oilRF-744-WT-GAM-9]MCG5030508.1 ribosome small subunit-dependent GTPase A [Mesosutterella sp. oilRF-744-WT-GAM-9]
MRPGVKKSPLPALNSTEALVIATHGRHHYVRTSEGRILEAHRRGKKADVVVGDRVKVSIAGGLAAIEEILPRSSLLYRSDKWRVKELAANIDQVAVVFASRPTFNPWFIWKALLAAGKAGIEAIAVRNKSDLQEGAPEADEALALLSRLGVRTISVSARVRPVEARGLLEPLLRGRRTLLVGQSGMGKSTLLNLLVPEAQALTREFSEALDLGKQTTTAARWYDLTGGGAIVDSPGFQEFGLEHLSLEDVISGMPDIAAAAARGCRFANCRHLSEPGCAVKAALDRGEISPRRYEFYEALARSVLSRRTYAP